MLPHSQEDLVDQIKREITIMKHLKHPNVVNLKEVQCMRAEKSLHSCNSNSKRTVSQMNRIDLLRLQIFNIGLTHIVMLSCCDKEEVAGVDELCAMLSPPIKFRVIIECSSP